MATSIQQNSFIATIAPIIQKYSKQYGYKVASPIIAQACIESAYGQSQLGAKYHNYFGMKCGSSWKGKSVNLTTKEEYSVGNLTTIKDNFRVYDNMDQGVKGYFEFISSSRYSNLKSAKTAQQYLEYIKSDGYATSSTYVNTNMKVVNNFGLTKYDNFNLKSITEIANEVIANKWGSGTARKQALESAGYNYSEVQAKVNEILKVQNNVKINYYPKYTGSATQLDTILAAIGVPVTLRGNASKRIPIAKANGITKYTGTAAQNTTLIKLAKTGKLIKP
mgnify:CR=1 FL=1